MGRCRRITDASVLAAILVALVACARPQTVAGPARPAPAGPAAPGPSRADRQGLLSPTTAGAACAETCEAPPPLDAPPATAPVTAASPGAAVAPRAAAQVTVAPSPAPARLRTPGSAPPVLDPCSLLTGQEVQAALSEAAEFQAKATGPYCLYSRPACCTVVILSVLQGQAAVEGTIAGVQLIVRAGNDPAISRQWQAEEQRIRAANLGLDEIIERAAPFMTASGRSVEPIDRPGEKAFWLWDGGGPAATGSLWAVRGEVDLSIGVVGPDQQEVARQAALRLEEQIWPRMPARFTTASQP